jgi:uncharacterized protein
MRLKVHQELDIRALVDVVRDQYALPWNGIHGISHWTRVRENGLRLAASTGADAEIVECFAYLHDSKRTNEGRDPGHGSRAAQFARTLRGTVLNLSDERLELLAFACAHHTDGLIEADVTVQTCWDADRLDLGRVSIFPLAHRLCTPAARDPLVMQWAIERSQRAGS